MSVASLPSTVAVMKRLFNSLAVLVGLWLLASFLGVMFDATHKDLWTQSLMWALLSSVVLAPVFMFVTTASSDSSEPPAAETKTFEVDQSMEMNNQESTPQPKDEWPHTSEQHGDPGSSDPGPIPSSN
ncbi:hypothetical protein BSZ35_02095 [Salinibacter sp. 10B]|nr:hypothetical protein BSZ35_02095 [Salinibacter sp. 10B]